MAISDWPTSARPREKLIQRGANALSDAELLAIFLRTGCAGRSAVDLAHELLEAVAWRPGPRTCGDSPAK